MKSIALILWCCFALSCKKTSPGVASDPDGNFPTDCAKRAACATFAADLQADAYVLAVRTQNDKLVEKSRVGDAALANILMADISEGDFPSPPDGREGWGILAVGWKIRQDIVPMEPGSALTGFGRTTHYSVNDGYISETIQGQRILIQVDMLLEEAGRDLRDLK
jgi:hypothetical protein